MIEIRQRKKQEREKGESKQVRRKPRGLVENLKEI